MAKISSNELKWQAEDDARTMARYQEIMADSARRGRAIKAAKVEAVNLQKRATAMATAAGTSKKKK